MDSSCAEFASSVSIACEMAIIQHRALGLWTVALSFRPAGVAGSRMSDYVLQAEALRYKIGGTADEPVSSTK